MLPLWLVYGFFQLWTLGSCIRITGEKNYSQKIEEVFPKLSNFSISLHDHRPLTLGGQDFVHCCNLAVYRSLYDDNGTLNLRNTTGATTFHTDLDGLRTQGYPCDATYNGNKGGAAQVYITYRFCKSNCSGWQMSKNAKLDQWVNPLVGFIVPAVVFCLAIPRRRKVNLPESLFDVPLNQIGYVLSPPISIPFTRGLSYTAFVTVCAIENADG